MHTWCCHSIKARWLTENGHGRSRTLSMAGSCHRTPSCHGRRSTRKSRSPSESASCEASLASLATAAAVSQGGKRRPDAAVSLTATTSTCMVTYIMMDGVCKHKFFDMVADADALQHMFCMESWSGCRSKSARTRAGSKCGMP